MPTSTEFLALCRAQIALLTQGLGASLSVVYLTQELAEGAETRLVPVVAYPETAIAWQQRNPLQLPLTTGFDHVPVPRLLLEDKNRTDGRRRDAEKSPAHPFVDESQESGEKARSIQPNSSLVPQRQLVLPLIHEEGVLGLLVTERNDRAWTEWEQTQIQQIASTLAIACVLDQRHQWLDQSHQQQRLLQAQQHDVLDNLLHQFRNSLTALQTFSKLILRRLLPGDSNREIAASITREATRLRELSQQLEAAAIGMEVEAATPISLPPVAADWQSASSAEDTEVQISPGTIPLLPAAGVLVRGESLLLEPCSLMAVLEPLLASAGAIAQERNLTLQSHISANLPPIQVNAQALREVLNNLLENALKYTPAGQITVLVNFPPQFPSQLENSTSWLEICISDTGPGIPLEDLPHIFERRFRGVQAQGEIPGSGLGLAIARELVEQMHGRIQVFSPALPTHLNSPTTAGKPGTTFVVWLPVAE
ncbi:GAF domain-containing sensor histidine kinase [Kovacikia minuta CCNUW1]|uniref:GAF domain-containing sensor histidine kinase n=1 Tax=Kovacikia minuta TaxID=2931930 RepID=UPI001CCDD01C|nr:GAF domain-containing sensor histidine kinase [Kovacikia minuta]UBF27545.1 GAF domain-containing sensor histidine kinase [Kovacikia minuta CCNUW1]